MTERESSDHDAEPGKPGFFISVANNPKNRPKNRPVIPKTDLPNVLLFQSYQRHTFTLYATRTVEGGFVTLKEKLIASWPSPIVARAEVGRFTGGLLHPRTVANLDSLGLGPAGKITVGRRVAYDRDALAMWIESRATVQG